jgi:hypothetical protein
MYRIEYKLLSDFLHSISISKYEKMLMWLTLIYVCYLLTICRPSGNFSPFPFHISSLDEGWYSDYGGKWDAWASAHLASLGSHVHGKFSLLQVFIFSRLAH